MAELRMFLTLSGRRKSLSHGLKSMLKPTIKLFNKIRKNKPNTDFSNASK